MLRNLTAIALILVATSAHAQSAKRVARGQKAIFIVPVASMEYDGATFFTAMPKLAADVTSDDAAGMSINGRTDWATSGFPLMVPVKVETARRRGAVTEIELSDGRRPKAIGSVKLHVTGDATKAFAAMTIPVTADTVAYLDMAYDSIAQIVFTDELAALTPTAKRDLMRFAHIAADANAISATKYKEHLYIAIDLGRDSSVYNDLKLNQATRVALILNTRLLATLKAFSKPVKDAPQVYGLRINFKIPHRSFLVTTPAQNDTLQLYATSADIKRFVDNDITNQQFIDACVVIVNDNRIEVPLSAAS